MKYLTVVTIILMLGFGACGVGGSPLVGKWAWNRIEFEFFRNGNVTESFQGLIFKGTWRDLGNGRLWINTRDSEETFAYEIRGGVLILTADAGRAVRDGRQTISLTKQ